MLRRFAHARTDIPALLAELAAAKAEHKVHNNACVEEKEDLRAQLRAQLAEIEQLRAEVADAPPAWATFTADDMHGAGLETVAAEMGRDAARAELDRVRTNRDQVADSLSAVWDALGLETASDGNAVDAIRKLRADLAAERARTQETQP